MDKHLEVFKEMIDSESEVSHGMNSEKQVGNLHYSIFQKEAYVWDDVKDKEVADYTDDVYDLIQERMDADEQDHRDEMDHQRHLNNTYR